VAVRFYYAEGAQQKGPLNVDEMRSAGVTPDTLVWHEGMADWTPAGKVPELAELFEPDADVQEDGRPTPPSAATWPAGPVGHPPPSVAPQNYGPRIDVPHGYNPAAHVPPPQARTMGYAVGGPAGPSDTYAVPSAVPGHGASVASLVVGILAMVTGLLSLCLWWLSLPLSAVAIVLGHVGNSAHKNATGRSNGMAVGGLVCAYLGLVLTLIVWATVFNIFDKAKQKSAQQQQNQTKW
jgi:hypothetical protein